MNTRLSLFAIAAGAVFSVSAQQTEKISITDSINASGTITVVQPAERTRLLQINTPSAPDTAAGSADAESNALRQNQQTARTGYRVQVFEDNNPRTARSQAERYNGELRAMFPHVRTYVTFNSPYWRVKAGDFRTRSEAEAAMAEFRAAFPRLGSYMRVVRDRINIYD
ncbi:MAG: SPOR domain-containing protein [Muribaculaceae bacterium]|nr:SPOR domain-containing protein [Muribaculaceae bacterium]